MVQAGLEFELVPFQTHRCWDCRDVPTTTLVRTLIHTQLLPLLWGAQVDVGMGTEDNVNGPPRDVRKSSQNSTPVFLMTARDSMGAQVPDL